jgi:hypothetical protein
MSTLLVNKQGQVFRTRSFGKANKVGEQGETEGLIRHLIEKWPGKVVYFGQCRGELPCDVIDSCTPNDLNEWSTAAYQEECFAADVDVLKKYEPIAGMIQVAGYAPTFSHIDNPNGATVQAAAVRYSAPALNVMQKFALPRIIVNNDPRTYPRDQEMSMGWPHCRPVALLDQRDMKRPQVVGGKSYARCSRYASCESWGFLQRTASAKTVRSVCVAHAHFSDGIRNGDPNIWREIFTSGVPEDFKIYGKGWGSWDNWAGVLNADDVQEVLSSAVCCPVVSHTPGFYTGKPYVIEASSCIPLPHRDYPFKCKVPEDLVLRDFVKQANDLWDNFELRVQSMEWWRKACVPEWSVLDELLEKLWEGKPIDNFGGYV